MELRDLPLQEAVSAFKRALVRETLAAHGGNRSRAAAALKIERTSLLRLIRALGIADLPDAHREDGLHGPGAPSDDRSPPAGFGRWLRRTRTVPEMAH